MELIVFVPAAYRVRKEFCQDAFLSISALEMLHDLRKQFRQQLVRVPHPILPSPS
jgi:hypothetical protein